MKKEMKEVMLSLEWYDERIHYGVMRYASEHNWLIHSNANNMQIHRNIDPDGMIVSITEDKVFHDWVKEKKSPCVSISADRFNLNVPKVEPDYYAIGEMVANFFLERKFKNFASFYPNPFKPEPWIQERMEGFGDTVKKNNGNLYLVYSPEKDGMNWLQEENKLKMKWYQQELKKLSLPCAVFLPGDDLATIFQKACIESKLLIPEDIALIAVNNSPIICPYTPVPLSSVDPGWEQLGYRAASMLDRIMKGEKIPNKTFKIPPAGVIERQSSSIVAVEDRKVSLAVTYISKHLRNNPTVDEICKSVKTSRRQLERAFRKHFNRGIKLVVNRERTAEIKKMLIDTDLNAVDIAKKLNFNNEFQMYRMFKKHSGMTTKEFRQKNS